MLAALGQTPEGRKLIDGLTPMLTNGAAGALVGAATGNAAAGAVAGGRRVVIGVQWQPTAL